MKGTSMKDGIYNADEKLPWETRYFTRRELQCKGSGRIAFTASSRRAWAMLDGLRRSMGRPLIIVSAFRSPEHNAAVGGARNSYHMSGTAFDISTNGSWLEEQLLYHAQAHEFMGIGIYDTFVHLDARRTPEPVFWRG
jgi:zinc D-Ala-D-Ala carboxypeptidase